MLKFELELKLAQKSILFSPTRIFMMNLKRLDIKQYFMDVVSRQKLKTFQSNMQKTLTHKNELHGKIVLQTSD